jgi:hypothetical protein
MIMTGPKLTADHLAEIKRTDEERTPGKWDYHADKDELEYVLTFGDVELGRLQPYSNNPASNAYFIAQATEYMPQLVAEVERLTGENEKLRAQLEKAKQAKKGSKSDA